MWQFDQLSPFQRCLVSFYGAAAINRAPMVNHEELPRHLGREAEFWEEWEQWKSIAKPKAKSSVSEEKRAGASKSILSSFKTTA